jgi:hypothetical protein
MSRTDGRTGRRAAAVAAITAVCALAPLSAAHATPAPRSATQATAQDGWRHWHYVDTFETRRICLKAGRLHVIFGEARDYRCIESDDDYDLYIRSSRYDRD